MQGQIKPQDVAFCICASPFWLSSFIGNSCRRAYKNWKNPPLEERVFEIPVEKQAAKPSVRTSVKRVSQKRRSLFKPTNAPAVAIDESASSFLRLPCEIRLLIYSYVFADRHIFYLKVKPRGRTGLRLAQSHTSYPSWWAANQHVSSPSRLSNSNEADPQYVRQYLDWLGRPHSCVMMACPWELLGGPLDTSLLQTCRQLNQECAPLLYSSNTWELGDFQHVLYLNQTISSFSMANIRFLQLTECRLAPSREITGPSSKATITSTYGEWLEGWQVIASQMANLQQLCLSLNINSRELEEEKFWLEPVAQLRGLTVFILTVSFGSCFLPLWSEDRQDVQHFREDLMRTVKSPRCITI